MSGRTEDGCSLSADPPTEPGRPLRLEGVLVDWRCWEVRGHQDYSTELCV